MKAHPHPPLAARALAAAALLVAPEAYACGGCFSPTPPVAPGQPGFGQAVVQDAERVVFHHDPQTGKTLVWVEVRYTGAAEDFGWVLPLPSVPTVTVGTKVGLDLIDQRTAATFQLDDRGSENCRDPRDGCVAQKWSDDRNGEWQAGADAGASAPNAGADSDGGGPAVTILAQGQTGPYDYAVISGKDGSKLQAWLDSRGYKTPQVAVPILQSHADKSDVFVAIKLSNGKGVNLIRPVVLEMDDGDPCVPLRLTSIAAAEEMSVIVTLGGPGRAVPMNHMEVQLNPARINWWAGGNNFAQVLAAAIDEASGRAFFVESAQKGASLPAFWSKEQLDTKPFAQALSLHELAMALFDTGAVWLHDDAAQTFADAQPAALAAMAKIGDQNTTPTAQLAQLWVCGAIWRQPWRSPSGDGVCRPSNNPFGGDGLDAETAKNTPVDGVQLAKALDKEIATPLLALFQGLQQAPMVTRLSMRISPDEMDRDPIFGFHPDLPEVARLRQAKVWQVCGDGWFPASMRRLELPGVGSYLMPLSSTSSAADPRFVGAPAALGVFAQDESGAPIAVPKANIALVDTAIAGALPGQPSPARKLALGPATPWNAPSSDPPVTKLVPWKMPPQCTPKPGWKDGALPPKGQAIPDRSNPAGDPPTTGFDVVGGADASGGGGGGKGNGGNAGGGCSAGHGPGGGGAGLLLGLLLALGVALRRRAMA